MASWFINHFDVLMIMTLSLRYWSKSWTLITETFCDTRSLSIHKSLSVSLLAQKNCLPLLAYRHHKQDTVYFSHPCISLRVRPDLQASASQSDLVLTVMKTVMNRMNNIKETELVFEKEKQDWWTKKNREYRWLRHFHMSFR